MVDFGDAALPHGKIHAAIVAIMAEAPSVAKTGHNQKQNYQFRKVDDLFAACQPLMAKHGIHVYPHRVVEDSMVEREVAREKGPPGLVVHVRQRIEFRFQHSDGSHISVETTGEAMDHGGDKASNKAMSAAIKYALIQVFCIPTGEDIDTENASPEAGKSRPGRAQRPPPGEPQGPPPEDVEMVDVMGKAEGSGVWAVVGRAAKLWPRQQARMKILQKELGVEDGPWREQLFKAFGKSSSAELSADEADQWIAKLERSKRARSQKGGAPAGTT